MPLLNVIRLRFVYKPCVSFSVVSLSSLRLLRSLLSLCHSLPTLLAIKHCSTVPCVFIIIIKAHLMQEVLCVYHSRFMHATVASLSSVVSICLLNLLHSLLFLSLSSLVAMLHHVFWLSVFFITHDAGITRCGLSVFASWIFVHETLLRLSHDDHPVWGFPCS